MNTNFILPQPTRNAIIETLENSVMPAREVKAIITALMQLKAEVKQPQTDEIPK